MASGPEEPDILPVKEKFAVWKQHEKVKDTTSSEENTKTTPSKADTQVDQAPVCNTVAQAPVSRNSRKHTMIVLFGKTGNGKSATCNRILGKTCSKEGISLTSVTEKCDRHTATLADGRQVTVVDTPGMFDTERTQKETIKIVTDCVELCLPGPHVFLLILSCKSRYTEEEHNTLMELQNLFGERIYQHTIVLFTHFHSLGDTTIEEFHKTFPASLLEIIKYCEDRMIYVENKEPKAVDNYSTELLRMIDDLVGKRGHYIDEKFNRERIEREIKTRMEEQSREIENYRLEIKKLEAEKKAAKKLKNINQQKLDEIEEEKDRLKRKGLQTANCFIL